MDSGNRFNDKLSKIASAAGVFFIGLIAVLFIVAYKQELSEWIIAFIIISIIIFVIYIIAVAFGFLPNPNQKPYNTSYTINGYDYESPSVIPVNQSVIYDEGELPPLITDDSNAPCTSDVHFPSNKTITDTPSGLPVVLHIATISILLFIKSCIFFRKDFSFMSLFGEAVVLFGFAAVITGLAWLVFRKKDVGKVRKSFIIASWVIFTLILFGQYQNQLFHKHTIATNNNQTSPYLAEQPPPAQLPMSAAAPPPSKPVSQMTEEEIKEEHARAQAIFKQLYPRIMANPTLLAEANKRFYAKLDQGKSITDAMLEAGEETNRMHQR